MAFLGCGFLISRNGADALLLIFVALVRAAFVRPVNDLGLDDLSLLIDFVAGFVGFVVPLDFCEIDAFRTDQPDFLGVCGLVKPPGLVKVFAFVVPAVSLEFALFFLEGDDDRLAAFELVDPLGFIIGSLLPFVAVFVFGFVETDDFMVDPPDLLGFAVFVESLGLVW